MKTRFPGFKQCMAMMRDRDSQTQEDGFHFLLPHAGRYLHELIKEYDKECLLGLRCWLLELIGSVRSPDSFDFLARQLLADEEQLRLSAIRALKELDTKQSRTLLWQSRSFIFKSSAETEAFRSAIEAVFKEEM